MNIIQHFLSQLSGDIKVLCPLHHKKEKINMPNLLVEKCI